MRLVMLPCAGGNSLMFQKISSMFQGSITVHCLDYPGHGKRIELPLLKTIEEISEDLITEMDRLGVFDGEPYALLGYSMGAVVCYEITRCLMARQRRLPDDLFLCASSAIHIETSQSLVSISDAELYTYLKELGGTEEELLDDREFQEFYYPIIEADLIAVDHYQRVAQVEMKLQVQATVLYGSEDKYTMEEIKRWEAFVNPCVLEEIKGSHFFIYESKTRMKNILEKKILA